MNVDGAEDGGIMKEDKSGCGNHTGVSQRSNLRASIVRIKESNAERTFRRLLKNLHKGQRLLGQG